MENNYKGLYHPKTLEEHHAAFLFGQWCDYTLASNGEVINIFDHGRARLEYVHLVHFFNTLGRNFFKTIHNFDDAEFTMYVLLGIGEYQDLQKIFSPDNAPLYAATGYSVPFTSEEIIEKVPEPVPAQTVEVVNEEDDEDIEETDISSEIEPRHSGERARYSGITRIHGQHIGISVPVPIKEASVKSDDYFIMHASPGPDDVVLAYPVERGKTIKDYSSKFVESSWKHPYLMALRHDYVERTGCRIQDVRKVTQKRWLSVERAKYREAKRKEKLRQKHIRLGKIKEEND